MRYLYSRILVVTLVCMTLCSAVYAQHYYVIVGAFAVESNAQKFTGYVRSHHYNGTYEQYVAKNLFYVYVLKTTNHDEAIQLTKSLQVDSEFKGAWVFKGTLGNEEDVKQFITEMTKPAVEAKDSVAETAQKIILDEPVPAKVLEPADSSTHNISTPVVEKTTPSKTDTVTVSSPVVNSELPKVVKGKLFKFVIETPDGRPVQGEVHQVDFRRGKDIATFKGNQYIDILNPMRNNPMTLVCGVFGYKEVLKEIDYNDPSLTPGATRDQHGVWNIPYKLERMVTGDISVMYHVSFYKDAVVMLPASKVELDELVNMMKHNAGYKIKIHGHCNGNNARKIIALGASKNYFNVKGSNEVNGTAKELSRLRAEAVQNYLIDNGIDKNRTDIYAWGALNMLVDEHSTSAKLNDRIEIEITAD